jgi:hypothetical protein
MRPDPWMDGVDPGDPWPYRSLWPKEPEAFETQSLLGVADADSSFGRFVSAAWPSCRPPHRTVRRVDRHLDRDADTVATNPTDAKLADPCEKA